MFDKSWTAFLPPNVAGPIAAQPISIGRPDTGEPLQMEINAAGISCAIFAGRLSTADCQSIINAMGANPQVDKGEIIALGGSPGTTRVRLADDVRDFTVYFNGSSGGAANIIIGVTVRVRTA